MDLQILLTLNLVFLQREYEQLSSERDSQTKPGTIWIPIGLEGTIWIPIGLEGMFDLEIH